MSVLGFIKVVGKAVLVCIRVRKRCQVNGKSSGFGCLVGPQLF